MTTAQSRSGRHCLPSAGTPFPYETDVDPTAATAAFPAVARPAAPHPAAAPVASAPAAFAAPSAPAPSSFATPSTTAPSAAAPSTPSTPAFTPPGSFAPPASFTPPTSFAPPTFGTTTFGTTTAGAPQVGQYPRAGAVPTQRSAFDGPVTPPVDPWPSRAGRQDPPQAPVKRRRKWPFVVGGILLLLVVAGMLGGNGAQPTATPVAAPAPTQAPAVQAPITQAPVAQAPITQAPAPVTQAPVAAEPAGPATSVGDGSYEVGVDMAAGKYKTTGPGADSFAGMCYQERSKDDSGEFDSIISNDIVQGPGVMTVKAGEVLKLSGGCQWTQQ